MLNLIDILYSFQIAVLAVVLLSLFEEGNIFAFWGRILNRRPSLPDWIRKPLGYCPRCFAGQLGFWFGICISTIRIQNALIVIDTTTHLVAEVIFKACLYAAFSIFFTEIIHARSQTTT